MRMLKWKTRRLNTTRPMNSPQTGEVKTTGKDVEMEEVEVEDDGEATVRRRNEERKKVPYGHSA